MTDLQLPPLLTGPEITAMLAGGLSVPPPPRPEQDPVPVRGLTPRENDVARGVADGLSNDQIARRLAISRWTVVNHLRHIMRKWDCATRVEVAVRTITGLSTLRTSSEGSTR